MTNLSTRKERWQRQLDQLSPIAHFILKFTIKRIYNIRDDFASRYINGKGYEIGAQNSPLSCQNAKKVTYIDYLSKDEISQKYQIPINECVNVDIIADANDLTRMSSNTASFVIANHVLEHSPNPVKAVLGWLRILQPGGILFLTLPNYRSNEFDFEKSPTEISHFIQDYQKAFNNEDISTVHINEHVRIIDGIDPENDSELFNQRCNELIQSNLHTHYHVFNKKNSLDLFKFIHRKTPIKICNYLCFTNGFELLFIIEKSDTMLPEPLVVKNNQLINLPILLKNIVNLLFSKIVGN